MDDRKADAAYHPYFKPRDEISQKDVDMREQLLGVDLSTLPRKPLHELGRGNIVLHEGVWVQIDEYEVNDQEGWVRLKFIRPLDTPGSTWARHIITSLYEGFYVPQHPVQ